jgi:hypothetical protein
MEPTLPTGTGRSWYFPEQVKEAFLRFEQWLMLGTGKRVAGVGHREIGALFGACAAQSSIGGVPKDVESDPVPASFKVIRRR